MNVFPFLVNAGKRTYPDQLIDNGSIKYKRTIHDEKPKNSKQISNFKLYLPSNVKECDFNAIGSLSESCQKSKVVFEFMEILTHDLTHKYIFTIEDKQIANATATNKKDAKRQCAENAIRYLRQYHEVIYKDQINHDSVTQIEKHNLVKHSYTHAPKISEDNLGSKLLKKMGWDGSSGVGKFNHGRSEPVFVDSVENREGIGHKYEDRSVRKNPVEKILSDFIRNQTENEIKFSKDLSKLDFYIFVLIS